MVKPIIHRVFPAILLGVISQCTSISETTAQSSSSNLTQERRGDAARGSASAAQVGAGTTSGSTTGSSGPKAPASTRISLPPPPSAQMCEVYKDTPVYQNCLSVTLRQ